MASAVQKLMEADEFLVWCLDKEARYELVDEVLVVTKQANVSKMGFVGNEAYAKF